MLSLALLAIVSAAEPSPLVTGIKNCEVESKADIVVCGQRAEPYRIDPNVLAVERRLDAPPIDTRNGLREATARSCHEELTKCDGNKVIPLLPMALKAAEAATLALHGEDWKEAFRTRPDTYSLYRQSKERGKARIGIGVGMSNRRP